VSAPPLPEGLVVIVKRECETCVMVVPVLGALQQQPGLTIYVQDDPTFPEGLQKTHDQDLAVSWHQSVEAVPTLLRVQDGVVADRTEGWLRTEWERVTGIQGLGPDLPPFRPGCGSLSVDPDLQPALRARFEGDRLRSRRIELADREDEFEALFERGVTDGLPVVPPTEERVLAMLEGTSREASDVVAIAPPDLVELTVEKVAVNAVMAGCKPEYLPVVLAALEAACTDEFNMHGVLATTMPVGPVIIVNGPITRAIGMNSGGNALGQGNRANLTIGRAVQLTIRNVGGGRPGGVDRATHGNPGKLSFCFAEDESSSPFTPLHVSRGFAADESTVTLFAGEGPRCVVDQLARDPEALATSLAACLRTVHHPKLVIGFDAILVLGPEHARVFADAGWDRDRVIAALHDRLLIPMDQLARGADGMAEGVPPHINAPALPKFRPDGVLLVHAGGGAGLFSAIIAGWANGALGSQPVTHPITV